MSIKQSQQFKTLRQISLFILFHRHGRTQIMSFAVRASIPLDGRSGAMDGRELAQTALAQLRIHGHVKMIRIGSTGTSAGILLRRLCQPGRGYTRLSPSRNTQSGTGRIFKLNWASGLRTAGSTRSRCRVHPLCVATCHPS